MQRGIEHSEALAAVKGMFVAVLISAALWYGLAAFGVYVLRWLAVLFSTPLLVKSSIYFFCLIAMVAAIWMATVSSLRCRRRALQSRSIPSVRLSFERTGSM